MRRVLLITLSLVLVLVGWSTVGAQDGFYVIPTMKGKYAPVPKTGQTTGYGTRDDGDLQKGVAWPIPRFTDNGNGTVKDNLTGLIWMKNANAFGTKKWTDALSAANTLKSGDPGTDLTDDSQAGDWRLPNVSELQSLIDYEFDNPAIPNTLGTAMWVNGDPFEGVQTLYSYWSSTTLSANTDYAWVVYLGSGHVNGGDKNSGDTCVWCVRGGK